MKPEVKVEIERRRKIRSYFEKGYIFIGHVKDKSGKLYAVLQLPYFIRDNRIIGEEEVTLASESDTGI